MRRKTARMTMNIRAVPAEAVKAATTNALTEDICGKMRAALGK